MTLQAFPKPKDSEGRITLTQKERRALLVKLLIEQDCKCCTCRVRMSAIGSEYMTSATLGHRNPQPAGCSKDDRRENILGAQCFRCNSERGSKRG